MEGSRIPHRIGPEPPERQSPCKVPSERQSGVRSASDAPSVLYRHNHELIGAEERYQQPIALLVNIDVGRSMWTCRVGEDRHELGDSLDPLARWTDSDHLAGNPTRYQE